MEATLATNMQKIEQEIDTVQKRKQVNVERIEEDTQQVLATECHIVDIARLESNLRTDLKSGLSQSERASRLEKNGPNKLKEGKKKSILVKILMTQLDLFALLLWAAAIVVFVMYFVTKAQNNLWLAISLVLVNFCSGALNFFQEFKSSGIMKSFNSMIPETCLVYEDGIIKEVDTSSLVVGDLIKIQAGMKCPADVRLISQNKLKVDLSSFNGESEPTSRSIENTETNILRATNIVFFTSHIVQGDGIGVVILTGSNTVIGGQVKSVTDQKDVKTPIQKEVGNFVKIISIFAIVVGILFLGISIGVKMSPLDAFVYCVGIIIACVPEGLSITITVSLALSAKKLAKKSVLVKELKSVETLGSVSVICSDKTGTITLNQMTVSHSYDFASVNKHEIDFAEGRFVHSKKIDDMFIRVLAINSRCELDLTDQNANILTMKLMGDASEVGITRFCNSMIGQEYEQFSHCKNPILDFRSLYPKHFEIPFSSVYKFQYSVHHTPDREALHTVKGAPERVIDMCDRVLQNGEVVPITPALKAQLFEAYQEIAAYGERVLGLGYKVEPMKDDYETEISNVQKGKFIMLGLISLIDPPKEGVKQAVSECFDAKIQVIMITGDHHLTATSIAKTVGILTEDIDFYTDDNLIEELFKVNHEEESIRFSHSLDRQSLDFVPEKLEKRRHTLKKKSQYEMSQEEINMMPVIQKNFIVAQHKTSAVMTGNVLESLVPTQLKFFLSTYEKIVFARTTPEQKLAITKTYQSLDKITAVSGDGLNDAPALKAADIGVAMASGSEIAREAGDIILMDDSFATIVYGVKEGRLIYENIKKAMAYTVTSCVPQIFPFLLFITLGFPNALSAIQILLLDVVTDIYPAFGLAYEIAESDLMMRAPRHKERMLNGSLASYSYGQVGCFMALSTVCIFMLVIRQQMYMYYPCVEYSGSIFLSLQHIDFESVTLTNLLSKAAKTCPLAERLPKRVNSSRELANYIFQNAQTASYLSIVTNQFFHAFFSRTRLNSIFQQGLFTNPTLFLGVLLQMGICCIFIYVPFCNTGLQTESLDYFAWVICIPWGIFMCIYDEIRKLILRKKGKQSTFWKLMYW